MKDEVLKLFNDYGMFQQTKELYHPSLFSLYKDFLNTHKKIDSSIVSHLLLLKYFSSNRDVEILTDLDFFRKKLELPEDWYRISNEIWSYFYLNAISNTNSVANVSVRIEVHNFEFYNVFENEPNLAEEIVELICPELKLKSLFSPHENYLDHDVIHLTRKWINKREMELSESLKKHFNNELLQIVVDREQTEFEKMVSALRN